MGNPRDRYNPANSLVRTKDGDLNVAEAVDVPEDQEDVQSRHRSRSGAAQIGIENADEEVPDAPPQAGEGASGGFGVDPVPLLAKAGARHG